MPGDPFVVVGPTRPEVTLQRVGKEAILHDAASGRAARHQLGSAARVWELMRRASRWTISSATFAAPFGRRT